jgi:cell wall-associated NlpC family hydrolase
MTPADFIAQARALIGTPFMHQGRTQYGLDCIGLAALAARRAGTHITWDRTCYPRDPTGELKPALDEHMVTVHAWCAADILLFRFGLEPQHVGIWTGRSLIHTPGRVGRVVEHDLDDWWSRRVVAAYRFPEFAA